MNETQTAVSAAPNLQAALLQIAISLDRLHAKVDEPAPTLASIDSWNNWTTADAERESHERSNDEAAQFDADETVNFPPVSWERQGERRAYARDVLDLNAALDDLELNESINAYGKGGAAWLYAYDRNLVMQYPEHIKRALVEDVEIDNPKAAQEMSRDILKMASNPPPVGA